MLRILMFLTILLLTPLTAQATTDWDEGFEYANGAALAGVWSICQACTAAGFDSGTNSMSLSTTRFHGGTKSLKEHFTGHNGGGYFIERSLPAPGDTLFTRYWMYMDTFTVDSITTKSTFHTANANTYPNFWWGMPNGNAVFAVDIQGIILDNGVQDTQRVFGGSVPQNQWVCVETQETMSTAGVDNGILRQWINGTQTMNKTTQRMRAATLNKNNSPTAKLDLIRLYRQDGVGDIYYDDYAVSRDARIGCGTLPVGDTTAPGATTNLTAPQTSATSSALTWTVAADTGGSGLKQTDILRCQGLVCTPIVGLISVQAPGASYLDSSLAAGTIYGYAVQGVDNSLNKGPLSATVYLTTPSAGSGTIAFDAVTNSAAGNTLAALPVWSHTVGAGANRLIAVCTQSRGTAANVPVVSVTYGGAALALARGDTRTDGAGVYFRTELWYLKAPTSGAANVAVTFTGTLTYGIGTATSFSGVDQTTTIEASSGSSGTGSTLSATVTSLTSDAWIQDCALGRTDTPSGLVSVGAGQVSRTNRVTTGTVDAVGVSTVNGKTPAGGEVMDWTQGTPGDDWVLTAMAIKPATSGGATPEPVIDSVVRTATTMTMTYGSTTLPTSIQIIEGFNAAVVIPFTQTYTRAAPPFDSATATTAILTRALTPGADFFCALPVNATGVVNQSISARKCVTTTGLAPIDTSAPTLGTVRANGNTAAPQLPNGATSFTLSVPVDKVASVRWDTTTHATFDAFPVANTMSLASLTASGAISSGVPAYPATQIYYLMPQRTDVVGVTHDGAVSTITVSAAAPAGDTTAPATVNVTAFTASGPTQATGTWDATTDGVGVTGYTPICSFGAGATNYVPCGNVTLLTYEVLNLPANTVVNFGVLANDLAGNVSLTSNIKTITMPAQIDVNPPSSPSTLRSLGTAKKSVILTWPAGSDAEGPITTLVEECLQSSAPTECTAWYFKQDQITETAVSLNLVSSTSYCWRIWHVDHATVPNKSVAPSNVVCDTTKATGIDFPRTRVPIETPRTQRP